MIETQLHYSKPKCYLIIYKRFLVNGDLIIQQRSKLKSTFLQLIIWA